MKNLIILAALALSATAEAGKLAEGYRGLAYGAYETFPSPEGGTCGANPEPGVAWLCEQTIGAVPVRAAYIVDYGLFYAVLIQSQGVGNCMTLMDTFTAAWGPSTPVNQFLKGRMDDRSWRDGDVLAGWKYNQFTEECSTVLFHRVYQQAVTDAQKKKAAEAVNDL